MQESDVKTAATVKSLTRGLSILEAFDHGNPKLGITEISKKTGLAKSTVYRLIQTLCELSYVMPIKAEDKYTLGPKVLNLGFSVLSSLELRDVASPYIRNLSQAIGETVNLAVLDGWQLTYVDRVKTQQIVNINLHIGSRLELYNTSMGRVLAAFQREEWLEKYFEYLRRIPEAGEYWKDSGKRLLTILEDVRDKGYAINNEELAPGLRSVAAPVKKRTGEVVGAVNIAVNSSRFSLERLGEELILPLKTTTQAISAALGY